MGGPVEARTEVVHQPPKRRTIVSYMRNGNGDFGNLFVRQNSYASVTRIKVHSFHVQASASVSDMLSPRAAIVFSMSSSSQRDRGPQRPAQPCPLSTQSPNLSDRPTSCFANSGHEFCPEMLEISDQRGNVAPSARAKRRRVPRLIWARSARVIEFSKFRVLRCTRVCAPTQRARAMPLPDQRDTTMSYCVV